jgi:hypothetical protein
VLPWQLAAAETADGAFATTLVAESWYRAGAEQAPALDGCGIPTVGCAPLPVEPTVPNQYPARTLHVGVAASAEESRTYITLVSSSAPIGTDVLGGTLTLPVATDTEAGTVAPETASLRACLVTGQVKNGVEGGVGGAPPVDCSVSSPAVFRPAKGDTGPLFTIDLKPFAKELSLGQASLGLVPGEDPGAAWHAAFSRSDRDVQGARPISAVLTTTADAEEPAEAPIDEGSAGVAPPPGFTPEGPAFTPGLEDVPMPVANPPATVPTAGPVTAAPVRVAAARTRSRSEPSAAALLLPLLVAGGAVWVSRAFTRELLPVRA